MLKMRHVLLALCTVCSLLSAVNSLDCLTRDGGTSIEKVQTCSSSETCLTISLTSLGFEQLGFTPNSFVKKCGPRLQTCGQLLSAKFTFHLRVDARVECCDTNQCNTGVYDVALTGGAWNGKQCPSCVSNGSCGIDLVNCLGTQDQCITVTGAAPGFPSATLKGCATKAACDKDSLLMAWPFLSNLQVACKLASANGFIPLGINMFMIAGAASLALGFVFN
ncbi:phospholipase A2 inhibitor subunit gamma B-like [Acipenser oxyrinchus oxyrinchus]|uniref:Phospholipase A2 inhibitor subunit gamma B-like n=1 Tax=Acipenser oxyrinchus oxyrinchus TaxID=40147 RepID=A0AAD8D1M7_ACIOX|nr:phospholipase A2 inhibitor subunit gamma B-like [Acipenser oxyrinchus oxyrinchus]